MSNETASDVQADIEDLLGGVRTALEALQNAESCENATDLRANLAEAHSALKSAALECRDLYKRAQVAGEG